MQDVMTDLMRQGEALPPRMKSDLNADCCSILAGSFRPSAPSRPPSSTVRPPRKPTTAIRSISGGSATISFFSRNPRFVSTLLKTSIQQAD